MRIFFFFLIFIFGFSVVKAQYSNRLPLGNTVPNVKFSSVVNSQILTLSDLKGKIVIIDFWSRGCGSCIASFPRIELLNSKYADKIVIVAVTKDSYQQFEQLRLNSKIIQESRIPFVIADTTLNVMFPHRYVPYYAWINDVGEFVGTSTSISEAKIRHVINTGALNEYVVSKEKKQKTYYNYKAEKVGLKEKYWGDTPVYYELRTLTDDELNQSDFYLTQIRDSASGKTFGNIMHGTYLLDIIRSAFANTFKTGTTATGIDFLNGDISEYFPPKNEEEIKDWQKGRLYHFKMIADPNAYEKFKAKDLTGIMQLVLKDELGIRGRPLISKTDCYIIQKIENDTTTKLLTKHPGQFAEELTKEGVYIRNGTMKAFIWMLSEKLNSTRRRSLPFINQSGYLDSDRIDIDVVIGRDFDLKNVNGALKKYNLVVGLAKRELTTLALDVDKSGKIEK